MPNYKLVSAKEVLANVIRGTGYKLPSVYHDDILEWIPEGMGLLECTNSLITCSTGDKNCPGEVKVKNYCAELPCGFVNILAVENEAGNRMPESSSVRSLKNDRSIDPLRYARQTVWESNSFTDTQNQANWRGTDLEPLTNGPTDVYKIVGNRIQVGFECGFIKIHYLAIPTCKDGYPLIPDNTNIKLALEFHVIKRLIGAGYEHKVFTWDKADEIYKQHAVTGMGEISYRSLDTAARVHRTNIRLFPPADYGQFFQLDSTLTEGLI